MKLHRRLAHPKHMPLIAYALAANVVLAILWGPVLMILTVAGLLRHLGSSVLWVVLISYYANMMCSLATAAGLLSTLAAHRHNAEPVGHTTSHDGGSW